MADCRRAAIGLSAMGGEAGWLAVNRENPMNIKRVAPQDGGP